MKEEKRADNYIINDKINEQIDETKKQINRMNNIKDNVESSKKTFDRCLDILRKAASGVEHNRFIYNISDECNKLSKDILNEYELKNAKEKDKLKELYNKSDELEKEKRREKTDN